jgi:hypothetical protein
MLWAWQIDPEENLIINTHLSIICALFGSSWQLMDPGKRYLPAEAEYPFKS